MRISPKWQHVCWHRLSSCPPTTLISTPRTLSCRGRPSTPAIDALFRSLSMAIALTDLSYYLCWVSMQIGYPLPVWYLHTHVLSTQSVISSSGNSAHPIWAHPHSISICLYLLYSYLYPLLLIHYICWLHQNYSLTHFVLSSHVL